MKKAPRFVFLFVAFPLLAAADPAAPQEKKPAASEERPRLNLKLDDPARYTRETPRESRSDEALPSLGANARPLPASPMPTTTQPFPKDPERGER